MNLTFYYLAVPCVTSMSQKDVVFVIDGSGSICNSDPGFRNGEDTTCNNWHSLISAIVNITSFFTIGPSNIMVGLVLFEKDAKVLWTLDRYNNICLFNALTQKVKRFKLTKDIRQ